MLVECNRSLRNRCSRLLCRNPTRARRHPLLSLPSRGRPACGDWATLLFSMFHRRTARPRRTRSEENVYESSYWIDFVPIVEPRNEIETKDVSGHGGHAKASRRIRLISTCPLVYTADIIETFSRGQLPVGKDLRDGQSQRRLLSDHQDRHHVSEKEIFNVLVERDASFVCFKNTTTIFALE